MHVRNLLFSIEWLFGGRTGSHTLLSRGLSELYGKASIRRTKRGAPRSFIFGFSQNMLPMPVYKFATLAFLFLP